MEGAEGRATYMAAFSSSPGGCTVHTRRGPSPRPTRLRLATRPVSAPRCLMSMSEWCVRIDDGAGLGCAGPRTKRTCPCPRPRPCPRPSARLTRTPARDGSERVAGAAKPRCRFLGESGGRREWTGSGVRAALPRACGCPAGAGVVGCSMAGGITLMAARDGRPRGSHRWGGCGPKRPPRGRPQASWAGPMVGDGRLRGAAMGGR